MSKTFDQGREEIAKLCRYFADNRRDFFALGVKEAHVRQSLIDPFFEALGWDMRNAAMTALQYREVIPEDSLEIEGQQKAPDYTFRVGTLAKFYTEAKKCGVNINSDPGPAYQLRRYGWSAKVPLSILTDFEELGVYDCSLRPRPTDKASFGRIQYYRSEEYPDRWRELWDIFSRESVWAGAYDRYAASKRKRGTSEVDSEFLKEIEGWRDSLARNIALRNLYLGYDDLNTAVQRTIDRLIFLRMAEDRGSESYGQLLKLCEQPGIYARFMGDMCRKADEKYNSGIFHFKKEEGIAESPDQLTPKLQIDDKIFKPILQSLYFEHGSPYHFGVLPVEILGTVYERFLGKVIRLTPDHRAKVEEKPEVRKAGGVYYTPAYIVDYIVKNTVGKMIEGKSPAQLAGGKSGQPLRVLDMACGSGSFLLGAFQCLLDHCLKWYLENRPEKHKEAVYLDSRRKFWRLTITEKKRILITHIFGVDIDLQAVEVSKLSLLLKVLEGETDETVGQSRQLFHERALPNLSNNIKCGNSLIGPDYFSGRLIPDPDEMKRVNPFDWQREFPNAMKSGGFDCVIGNPPYIRSQSLESEHREYYEKKFRTATATFDIYVLFVEKAVNLVSVIGHIGFILPNKFFTTDYGSGLRKLIVSPNLVERLVDFQDGQVFSGAGTYTTLLMLSKSAQNIPEYIQLGSVFKNEGASGLAKQLLSNKLVFHNLDLPADGSRWTLAVGKSGKLLLRLKEQFPAFISLNPHIFQGLKTSADKIYMGRLIKEYGKFADIITDSNVEVTLEKEILKKVVKGEHVQRYFTDQSAKIRIIFPYYIESDRALIYSSKDMNDRFPRTWEYFKSNRKVLGSRDRGIWNDRQDWYAYARAQNLVAFIGEKLLIPYMTTRLRVAPDIKDDLFFVNITTGGYGVSFDYRKHHRNYFLALLNSHLLDFAIQQMTNTFRGGYFAVNKQGLERLPIRLIDFSNSFDESIHDKIVELVDSMLRMQILLVSSKSQSQKAIIERQIDSTDREIDQLVYKLYGLTEKEIETVEEIK